MHKFKKAPLREGPNSQHSYGDAKPDPDMMTHYDAIRDPVMMTHS